MNVLRSLKVYQKLLLIIVSGVLFMIGVATTGYVVISKANKLSNEMYEDRLAPVDDLNVARNSNRFIESNIQEIILIQDDAAANRLLNDIAERETVVNERVAAYEQTLLLPYEQERLPALKDTLSKAEHERDIVVEMIKQGKKEDAFHYYMENVKPSVSEASNLFNELIVFNIERANELNQTIEAARNNANLILSIITLTAMGLTTLLGIIIARMITVPVKEIGKNMSQAGKGDLTVSYQYTSKDELGSLVASFNSMVEKVRTTIQDVVNHANNLAASAEEISASTGEVAKGSQQQAEEAGNSSEMVKEMAYAIQQVSKNAEEAAQLSDLTLESATEGGGVINRTVEGMKDISTKINDLSSKSVQIGNIIEVIDDIADQTNLLALNAAIEAARAGDAGKGFAVVADEVRKLAERSSQATKEITQLIHLIQANTEQSVEAVNNGNDRAHEAGKAFAKIISLVQESASKVNEIAAASEEQAAQSSEVQLAVENIASVSEQTAASIEETAATAGDLAKMAEELNQLTMRFKV